MRILGLATSPDDCSAVLFADGKNVATAEAPTLEEAICRACDAGETHLEDVDLVTLAEKPLLFLERWVETRLAAVPAGFTAFRRALPMMFPDRFLTVDRMARRLEKMGGGRGWRSRLRFAEGHHCRAASAFFLSKYNEAAILVLDGDGDWAGTSIGHGKGTTVTMLRELPYPHSIALLRGASRGVAGGEPRHHDRILRDLVDLKSDGSFRLNLDYFDIAVDPPAPRFERLFDKGTKPADIAASFQTVTREIVQRLARFAGKETGCKYLCVAGGEWPVKIYREAGFTGVFEAPTSSRALGAALLAWHVGEEQPRKAAKRAVRRKRA